MTTTFIQHLSIGLPKKMIFDEGKEMETAIEKEPVTEAFLTVNGFQGDGVADHRFHGGPDRAVCLYPYEHYAFWEKEFTQTLPHATFGENVTVANLLEQDVHIGDTFQLGEAVIQITQGRIPCSTISKRTALPLLMKKMIETGYTGYLARVLVEGKVRSDSTMSLIEQHPARISILFANEVYFHRPKDVEAMKKIISVSELAEVWRQSLQKRMDRLSTTKS